MLTKEFGTDRTESKVSDAWRKGVIEQLLGAEPVEVKERSPQKMIESEDGSTSVQANRPLSAEEMAELFGIDLQEWYPKKRITNTWGKNWQTKIWWEPVELNIVARHWDELLKSWRARAEPIPAVRVRRPDDYVYEYALYDAHLGAKGWGPEVGEHMDLSIGLDRYEMAFRHHTREAPDYVERALHIVGQDLFHFDQLIQGKGGATHKGTPQDVDSRWQKLFVSTAELQVKLILHALEKFNAVDLLIQPGNHDTQTSYYLGEVLAARFHEDDRVRVDNTPKPRKYYGFGDCLIGFTHGDEEKAADLYGLMTEEAGVARWREWHRGHRHMEECSEDGRIRIRGFPALAGAESWHVKKGYRSIPGSRGVLWHRNGGIQSIDHYNVPLEETSTHNMGAILTG
jgi:hypothetical protein